jgi:hypothetical protein
LGGKQDASPSDSDTIPTPVVVINQDSDPSATIVEITFGDRVGASSFRYYMKPVTSSFSLLSMRNFFDSV